MIETIKLPTDGTQIELYKRVPVDKDHMFHRLSWEYHDREMKVNPDPTAINILKEEELYYVNVGGEDCLYCVREGDDLTQAVFTDEYHNYEKIERFMIKWMEANPKSSLKEMLTVTHTFMSL